MSVMHTANEDWDRRANELLGTGMLFGALMTWGADAAGRQGVTVDVVMNNGVATNQLLVKFDVKGPPAERGYLVTVTIPGPAA